MDIRIDDASPLISYHSKNKGWINDHSQGTTWYDADAKSYSLRTFHKTMTDGDYMELRFNGTGISVYGAKKANHGVYGVRLDGEDEQYLSGHAASGGQPMFQAELYKRTDLQPEVEHVITLTNYPKMRTPAPSEMNDSWLDIDFVTISGPVDGEVHTTTIEDDDPSIKYDSQWNVVKDQNFRGGSSWMSQSNGAVMVMTFNGSSIELFGGMNADHGNYSVSIDDGTEVLLSANNWERLFQVPKYLVTGLTEAQHTLRLTNLGTTATPTFGFDYALVRASVSSANDTEPSSAQSPSPSADSTNGSAGSSKSTNVGAVAGGVVGGVGGLILVAILAWCLFRPQKRRKARRAQTEAQIRVSRMSSFKGYRASTSGSDFEPKFSRARRVDVAVTDAGDWTPTLSEKIRSLFGRSRSRSPDSAQDGTRSESPDPDQNIAYLYAPNPNAIPAASSPQITDYDDIIRPPPSDLPRSATSMGSLSSAYYLDGTPTSDRTGMATTVTTSTASRARPRPTSIPSFNSLEENSLEESSDYSHIPLPPLPRLDSVNLPTRPGTSHTQRSSVLLPPTAINTPVNSGRTFGQGPGPFPQSATTPSTVLGGSPQSPPDTSATQASSSSGPSRQLFPSDYKISLLNLPQTDTSASTSTAPSEGTSDGGEVQILASAWRVEVPRTEERVVSSLISPPPDYLQAIQSSPDSINRSPGERIL